MKNKYDRYEHRVMLLAERLHGLSPSAKLINGFGYIEKTGTPVTTIKEIEKDDKVYTLVKVTLITGRHHQIRVQFAHRNHPLLGDTKYGDERFNNEIALCAAFLSVDGHEYSIEPSWQF